MSSGHSYARARAATIEGAFEEAVAILQGSQTETFPLMEVAVLWGVILEEAPEYAQVAHHHLKLLAPQLAKLPDAAFANDVAQSAVMCAALVARDPLLVRRVLRVRGFGDMPYAISPTVALRDWCRANATPLYEFAPCMMVDRAATSTLSHALRYETKELTYAILPEAQYLSGWDVILTRDGFALSDTGQMVITKQFPGVHVTHYTAVNFVGHFWPETAEFVDEIVLPLPRGYAGNIGHWLIGVLPRLQVAQKERVKLAVWEDIHPKEMEMLQLFGVEAADLLVLRKQTRYRFKAICATAFGKGDRLHPTSVAFVRQLLYRPRFSPDPRKKLYLRRGGVHTRFIVNEASLEEFLIGQGFSCIDLSRYSWQAQTELMSQAEIIVGLWGSNMFANYLAPPGCHVHVIWPPHPTRFDVMVVQLCAFLDQVHHYVRDCTYYTDDMVKADREAVVVDIDALRRQLEATRPRMQRLE